MFHNRFFFHHVADDPRTERDGHIQVGHHGAVNFAMVADEHHGAVLIAIEVFPADHPMVVQRAQERDDDPHPEAVLVALDHHAVQLLAEGRIVQAFALQSEPTRQLLKMTVVHGKAQRGDDRCQQ